MKLLIAASAVLLTTAVQAAESYSIDARHTFPVFEVRHQGLSLQRGRFNKTSGKITLDRAAKTGTIDITIDPASIDMGLAKWDEAMTGPDFFDVQAFPEIKFKASAIKFEGDAPASVEGQLTMRDVTKPVSLKVNYFKCGKNPFNKKDVCGADVVASIKRSEWGMDAQLPGVGDDVVIHIGVEAFKD